MRLGTKSILFGAHQFLIHPICLAFAWTKLYGFPKQRQLWVAFFIHDIGYWGKPYMDDALGETHPEVGAKVMRYLFGDAWGEFTLLHSRYYAKRLGKPVSQLCIADKLATCYMPARLYALLTSLTGEVHEYMKKIPEREGDYLSNKLDGPISAYQFACFLHEYTIDWVNQNKDDAKPVNYYLIA